MNVTAISYNATSPIFIGFPFISTVVYTDSIFESNRLTFGGGRNRSRSWLVAIISEQNVEEGTARALVKLFPINFLFFIRINHIARP